MIDDRLRLSYENLKLLQREGLEIAPGKGCPFPESMANGESYCCFDGYLVNGNFCIDPKTCNKLSQRRIPVVETLKEVNYSS